MPFPVLAPAWPPVVAESIRQRHDLDVQQRQHHSVPELVGSAELQPQERRQQQSKCDESAAQIQWVQVVQLGPQVWKGGGLVAFRLSREQERQTARGSTGERREDVGGRSQRGCHRQPHPGLHGHAEQNVARGSRSALDPQAEGRQRHGLQIRHTQFLVQNHGHCLHLHLSGYLRPRYRFLIKKREKLKINQERFKR